MDELEIINRLKFDFLSAKVCNCQDADVWRKLAARYRDICANLNYAYCVKRANECSQQVAEKVAHSH